MANTVLLPPATAVRIAWALTSEFSADDLSKRTVELVRAGLEDIRQRALAGTDPLETEYVTCTTATMDAARRSLETVYKGRQLNFDENEKLRSTYLEAIKQGLDFGNKAQDAVKSLPAVVLGGFGGSLATGLTQKDPLMTMFAGFAAAAAAYLINQVAVAWSRSKTQAMYVAQDYERSMYYDQYIRRVSEILTSLYIDVDRLHTRIFGNAYPVPAAATATASMPAWVQAEQIVKDMLAGVHSTLCQYVHKHMREGRVTYKNWTICETGNAEATKDCPFRPRK